MADGAPSGLTRRDFVAATAAAVVALPVLGPAVQAAAAEVWVATVRPEELPAGSYRTFTKQKFILSRTGDVVVALSAICSHQQCAVKPGLDRKDREKNLLVCPCHGGRFDAAGQPAGGPPKKPLTRFGLRLREGVIEVNVGRNVEGAGSELTVAG